MPLTTWPHLRAAFSAVSTASAPEFMGSARAMPVAVHRRSRKGPSRSLWKARDVMARREACAASAATSSGWPWPKLTAE